MPTENSTAATGNKIRERASRPAISALIAVAVVSPQNDHAAMAHLRDKIAPDWLVMGPLKIGQNYFPSY